MMPRFEDQESMDDEEMELVLNAIEYIKGLYLKHFQQSWADFGYLFEHDCSQIPLM